PDGPGPCGEADAAGRPAPVLPALWPTLPNQRRLPSACGGRGGVAGRLPEPRSAAVSATDEVGLMKRGARSRQATTVWRCQACASRSVSPYDVCGSYWPTRHGRPARAKVVVIQRRRLSVTPIHSPPVKLPTPPAAE